MNKLAEVLGESVVVLYLLCAAACAFLMSLLRSAYQESRKSFKIRLCEAFMCSMLASSLTMLAHLHLEMGIEYAMPVGTLVGYLGSDFISAVLIGWIKYRRLGFPDDLERERFNHRGYNDSDLYTTSTPTHSDTFHEAVQSGSNQKPDNPD